MTKATKTPLRKKQIKTTTTAKPKKASKDREIKFLSDDDLILVSGGRMMRNLADTN